MRSYFNLAGLQTLKLEKRIKKIFSDDELLPAAGQNICSREKNDKNIKILDAINHWDKNLRWLKSLIIGGDYHTAVGALTKLKNEKLVKGSTFFRFEKWSQNWKDEWKKDVKNLGY